MTDVQNRPQHPAPGQPDPSVFGQPQVQPQHTSAPYGLRPARNGFGVTALCLGLVGVVFALMPITGFLALILGVLAVIFGLLGWARARRGEATNRKAAIVGTTVGALVAILGVVGIILFFQATAQFARDMNNIATSLPSPVLSSPAYSSPSYSGDPGLSYTPYSGAPAAPAPAKPTSYTYEVTGNYRAVQLDYTDSNGDSVELNNTGNITTSGSKLPWSKTVTPEPNGNVQSLNAQTMSTKGDSWMTCTIKDNTGRVVATQTGKGAYAVCMVSTPFN